MKYLEIVQRTSKVLAGMSMLGSAVLLTACGASGVPNRAETWNSYYYGSSSASSERGISYYEGVDSDNNYRLPREYMGASDPRIPSENRISVNP